MRFISSSIVAGLAAALCASAASAAVINIDMQGAVYSGVGVAPGDTGIVWNAAVNGGTKALLSSTGAATSVTFTTDAMNEIGSGRPNDLMNSYIYTSRYNDRSFSIAGLAASTAYDLYIYSAPNNTDSTFTFGAQSITLSGTDATSAGFVLSDWGKLTVTSSGTGTIAGVLSAAGSGNYTAFNGLQISVPEPTTLAVLGLSGLALMRRRRDNA